MWSCWLDLGLLLLMMFAGVDGLRVLRQMQQTSAEPSSVISWNVAGSLNQIRSGCLSYRNLCLAIIYWILNHRQVPRKIAATQPLAQKK